MRVSLEIKDSYVSQVIEFLKLLPKEVISIKIEDEFKINKKECIKTLDKIKKGNTEDFEVIEDLDKHINDLKKSFIAVV